MSGYRMTTEILETLGKLGTLGYECSFVPGEDACKNFKPGEIPDGVKLGFVGVPQAVVQFYDYCLAFSNGKGKPIDVRKRVVSVLESFKNSHLFVKGKIWSDGPGGDQLDFQR